jgi:hypothetical protein
MAFAQLADLRFRIDPDAINWDYQIDATRIETLGGQVVQILGATLGDVTVTGQFGQDHARKQDSWQLALAFHKKIQQLIDNQNIPEVKIPIGTKASNGDKLAAPALASPSKPYAPYQAPAHKPVPFSYLDGVHNWQFRVLIKGITDLNEQGQAISHTPGKFAYGYQLTLFVVESNTDVIQKVASDYFIKRIASGLGWKQSSFNGPLSADQVSKFLDSHGGSTTAYFTELLGGSSAS